MTHPFLQKLDAQPLLCDGAMGTIIYNKGIPFERCFDALNLNSPAMIAEIHRAYIDAGANVIETNTFGANRFKLGEHGLAGKVAEINGAGVRLARRVVDASFKEVFIAGSVGPLGPRLAPLGRLSAAEARAALADQLERTNRELRETQAYLIQSEKMASLGQLVAGIAHEVNNPLTFVINNAYTVDQQAEKLLVESGDALPETAVQRLHKIRARMGDMRQGLDRVRDLIVNLRTFSRLDEGEFKTIDVHDSIDSVLMFLRHKTADRIEIVRDYAAKKPLDCYAGRLNQVVMNLVANAVDAIELKGTVTISTRETDEMFEISVRDTGCGIPDAVKAKIFDPFFTTKPVGQGTGLGLAISYGIVRDHDGAIEVHSTEGAGSEFVVKIPLNLKARAHGS